LPLYSLPGGPRQRYLQPISSPKFREASPPTGVRARWRLMGMPGRRSGGVLFLLAWRALGGCLESRAGGAWKPALPVRLLGFAMAPSARERLMVCWFFPWGWFGFDVLQTSPPARLLTLLPRGLGRADTLHGNVGAWMALCTMASLLGAPAASRRPFRAGMLSSLLPVVQRARPHTKHFCRGCFT